MSAKPTTMLWGLALAVVSSPNPVPGLGVTSNLARRVLVFTRTEGFRHDSIPEAIEAIRAIGEARGFSADFTEDPATFSANSLAKYRSVAFVLTTGDVLDPPQQEALRAFVERGGGFIGVHSASDTEYEWPWYGEMVGAYFLSHPPGVHRASLRIESRNNPTTRTLPDPWVRTDEWYDFRSNPRGKVEVLMTVDEKTYQGGRMGADHPVTWSRKVGKGRAWYTALGHTKESYREPVFMDMFAKAIDWSWGGN